MDDRPEYPADAGPLDLTYGAVQSPVIGECQYCQTPIRALHMDNHCPECGRLLPGEVPGPKAPLIYPEMARNLLMAAAMAALIIWLLSFGQP